VGTSIRISGQDFSSGESVSITFGGQQVATATADGSGSFSVSLDVPVLEAGQYPVMAGSFFVGIITITSTFSLSPSNGPPGTSVQILGTGFGPSTSVNLTIDGMAWQAIATDGAGSLRSSIQIPQMAGGPKTINVSGPGSSDGSATFVVTPRINVDQTTASPGATVNVNGTGFQSNEIDITITFNTNRIVTLDADYQGSWNTTFNIPPTPKGNYLIQAFGTRATSLLQKPITVTPSVSISKLQASPRASATVKGVGFAANESRINVTLGHISVASEIAANDDGSWNAHIEIPDLPDGHYALMASGSQTAIGSVQERVFTINSPKATPTYAATPLPPFTPTPTTPIPPKEISSPEVFIPLIVATIGATALIVVALIKKPRKGKYR
jgi:hypothetical protein